MVNYSIIIPHKNSPELLERCLNSIPERKDIEIIVVDDYSDESRRPQTKRADVKVIYLTKEQTKGAGRARNIGLGKAAGKWLLFADCDDYYINNAFDEFDKVKDTDYDIIFFDYCTNYGDGITAFKNKLEAMLQQGGKRTNANFKHQTNTPWDKLFRKEFIKKHNIQYEEIPIQNDAYFVHKAASLTDNFHYINEKLYFYEINDSGITRKKRKKEDIERSTTTQIIIDKIKFKSGALDCIFLPYGKDLSMYSRWFAIKQQLRRFRHGLLLYMIKKHI